MFVYVGPMARAVRLAGDHLSRSLSMAMFGLGSAADDEALES